VPSLFLCAVLAGLWWRKAIAEESRLAARDPAYSEYAARTRGRFLPML
jgi:protein-S-isoprenylcysteine O-methyltransferase Ste14